jgi:uncharacterized protein (DUF2062 family)
MNAAPPRRLTVPRKFLRRLIPDSDSVRARPLVALFGRWLEHPNLWHLNRHSVPAAFAIGLFTGMIPGPVQMFAALLLAVPLRKNIPVALVTTLYTNPLTIVPLYVLAYEYGALLLGAPGAAHIVLFEMDWTDWVESARRMLDWAISLGPPLAVGLVALSLTFAALGYFALRIGWRLYVLAAWRARARRRNSP